jgi:transposase
MIKFLSNKTSPKGGAQVYFIGVDHHKQSSTITVLDEQGREVRTARLLNVEADVAAFIREAAPDGFQAVLESGRSSYVMADFLRELGGEVKMANPYELKAIAHAQIKTDRRDSRLLARMLRTGLIPEIYQRELSNREAQRVMRQRAFWTRLQVEVKNKIRVLLAQQREAVRLGVGALKESLFGKKGLEYLSQVELRDKDRRLLQELVAAFRELEAHKKNSDGMVEALYQELPSARLIDTAPGFGKTLSVMVAVEIGDVRRFSRVEKLLSYAGVIPSTHGSGEKTYHGHLKQGNNWLRWALIEAVYPATQVDPGLSIYYHRLAARKGPNIAKAATARRLLTIIYRMLIEERRFIPYLNKTSAA